MHRLIAPAKAASWLAIVLLTGHLLVRLPVAEAAPVVGTFDYSRAGPANLATGSYTSEARASVFANFPGLTFDTTFTLTPEFLAGVDMLAITSVRDLTSINPLSASEQSALYNYVLGGGNVALFADGYSPYVAAAQSMVSPFGLTIVDDGVPGFQAWTPVVPAHPIFSGPFGETSLLYMYGAGNFTDLGPHANSLGTMDSTGLSVVAGISEDALAPGSGRVVIYADATLFADPVADGFFSVSENLYLNTFHYLLVPEPGSMLLAGIGLSVLCGWQFRGRRRRHRQ